MADDIHDAMPLDVKLAALITGGAEDFWLPQPDSDGQFVVVHDLGRAIAAFERAFGDEATVNQLAMCLTVAKLHKKRREIKARILKARDAINVEADAIAEAGNHVVADKCRAQPTPDYPERAADDAWLRRYCGYGV
jgi:hypothetical protein